MNKKKKVVVLMGGKSSEYGISVMSGQEVIKNLDKKKYSVIPLTISQKGKGLEKIIGSHADIVFIAMHGPYGEDGAIQGMLELTGVPYTGSGVLASAIGMDKIVFRKIMRLEKILIPKYVVVRKSDKNISSIVKGLGDFPYFVKPRDQGSSVGCSVVKNKKELAVALKKAFLYSDCVLIDEYIEGIELTCGVLGNENPAALPAIEIVPKGKFFDYKSKYTAKESEEIVPARISVTLEKKVRDLAIQVYKAIDAKGFGRVDFILKSGKLYVLEINTIPGLTPVSLLPKEAAAAGISYPKLLDEIIGYAIKK